jgi:hypothetical protein
MVVSFVQNPQDYFFLRRIWFGDTTAPVAKLRRARNFACKLEVVSREDDNIGPHYKDRWSTPRQRDCINTVVILCDIRSKECLANNALMMEERKKVRERKKGKKRCLHNKRAERDPIRQCIASLWASVSGLCRAKKWDFFFSSFFSILSASGGEIYCCFYLICLVLLFIFQVCV